MPARKLPGERNFFLEVEMKFLVLALLLAVFLSALFLVPWG